MNFTKPSRIVITCFKRLAPYVEAEVKALGFNVTRTFGTGVELRGTLEDCITLNLNLRCASQVHFSLREIRASHPDELYRALLHVPWEDVLDPNGYFSVTCHVENLMVNNTMYANVKVKDAIADRLRRQTGQRPDSGPDHSRAVIHLYWKDNEAEIFIDTSGQTLAKHGYRKIPGKAPMLEALAAATVMATRWTPADPFVNPMCGSGTLAIEAALLATHRAPGLFRSNYSFMHIKGYDHEFYKRAVAQLQAQVSDTGAPKIFASDRSADAVLIAQANAAAAGVQHLIQFDECDFSETPLPPTQNGIVIFNPEYGERLGEVEKLEDVYTALGDFLKQKCKGFTGYIFTGNLDLAKKIGLKASRRIEFYSAKLDCRLLEYELYEGTKRKTIKPPRP